MKIDLIRLTPTHWQRCVSDFRDIRKGWLRKISCRIRNAMFNILHEIFKSHPFLMSGRCWQGYGAKRIKSNFADRGSSGTRFGAPLYYLKSGILFSFLQKHRFWEVFLQRYEVFGLIQPFCCRVIFLFAQVNPWFAEAKQSIASWIKAYRRSKCIPATKCRHATRPTIPTELLKLCLTNLLQTTLLTTTPCNP